MSQISLKNELYRKIAHFMLLAIPIAYYYLGKWQSLIIFASLACVIVSLDYLRRKSPKIKNIFNKIFGVILREHEVEGDILCGASFVAISTCINFLIFKPEIAVTAFAIFVVSDGLAALVGRNFPSKPFFEKSVTGAAAFFISGLVVLIVCALIYDAKFGFYFFGLFALAVVTIIESRPSLFKTDDNLTITLGFSISMTLFDLMWGFTY